VTNSLSAVQTLFGLEEARMRIENVEVLILETEGEYATHDDADEVHGQ